MPVNVGVFFSSYKVLKETEEVFFTAYDFKRPFFKESPNMTLREADKICSSFKSYKSEGALLFAVQGCRFSEGEKFSRRRNAFSNSCRSLPTPSNETTFFENELYKKNAFLKMLF